MVVDKVYKGILTLTQESISHLVLIQNLESIRLIATDYLNGVLYYDNGIVIGKKQIALELEENQFTIINFNEIKYISLTTSNTLEIETFTNKITIEGNNIKLKENK